MIPGAVFLTETRCRFTVWAPFRDAVALAREDIRIPLERADHGYWTVTLDDTPPGTRYRFVLDNETERPDPASRFQPEGVHGPSETVDPARIPWTDALWRGIPPERMIFYEMHVGTFTPEGTFDAVIEKLDYLAGLGITALEIMPVSQFPGERNWGYDGTYPFAPQNSYGGPEGLMRLVDACHARGLAAVLDVVYNHMGPEGNYLRDFGPYFTDRHRTPWGDAVNFDGPHNGGVREFFIQNAISWFRDYHFDALRLDAVHGIYDLSASPFLAELTGRVGAFSRETGRRACLIAESDLNDTKVMRSRDLGGYGFDVQWNDDFHHALHTLLTDERAGYYIDYGRTSHLVKALRDGFVLSGEYSRFRERNHGNSSRDILARGIVVFSQNHDQVGNRMLGDRLASLVPFEALKLAAGAVILSPYLPLLFMGEEYGEDSPFLYFVSHTDPELARAVNEGRKREFSGFLHQGEPPAPEDPDTFLRSKLRWDIRTEAGHAVLLRFYRQLIDLRKTVPALARLDKDAVEAYGSDTDRQVLVRRNHEDGDTLCILSFSDHATEWRCGRPEGKWRKLLDSSGPEWMGPGSRLPERLEADSPAFLGPYGFAVYLQEEIHE